MPAAFNFHNEPTFHFYRWATFNDAVVDLRIERAWNQLPNHELFDIHPETSYMLRDNVAQELEELLDEILSKYHDMSRLDVEIGGINDTSPESLFGPILADAVNSIPFLAVAEAILRDKGKWAPEKAAPKAI
jgi:hypothetical protein